jgi:hypothetical protein
VLSVLLVSTAAASSKRMWFPTFFHRKAALVEPAGAVAVDPPATRVSSGSGQATLEEPPSTKAVGPASPRARASGAKSTIVSMEEPKSEPVRPRLLSDPQNDAIPRVLPKGIYDARTYSVLLDVSKRCGAGSIFRPKPADNRSLCAFPSFTASRCSATESFSSVKGSPASGHHCS